MIIYFSGTGNSYSIAKKLGERLDEKVVPLKRAKNDNSANMIFVFPVYCGDIPPNVRDFLKRFQINENQKVMGICTSGGDSGNAEYAFNQIMKSKGFIVDKFLNVTMEDNSYPVLFGSDVNPQYINENKFINEFEELVYKNRSGFNPLYKVFEILFFNSISKQLLKKKIINEKCTACGICCDICPNDNIVIANKKAHVGHNCAECFGCVHVCPYQAIYVRRRMKKANQYMNENIRISELNK